MQERISFEFAADVENVLKVRDAANSLCLRMGFGPVEASLVITAVWEAVLNAVTHGSPNGDKDSVQVTMTSEDDTFHIDIISRNTSFRLPDGKPVLNPSGRRGRGIPLMYAFMDSIWLSRENHTVTLHMTKRLENPAVTHPSRLERECPIQCLCVI